MDLTYNPGELDFKHLQKDSSHSIKRDHDSVDDFEHLDPESSPVDISSKPLIEIGSKSDLPATSVNIGFSDNLGVNDKIQITKPEVSSFDNVSEVVSDISTDSKQPKSNVEFHEKTNQMEFEITPDNIPKTSETVQFDNALISDFISAEKGINSVKTDFESGLVGLESHVKDSNNEDLKGYVDTSKSIKDDSDFKIPGKSMKEADAMSHYDMKFDKKDIGKNDSHTEEEKDLGSLTKHEVDKNQDSIETLINDDPLKTNSPSNDFISVVSPLSDSKEHQINEKLDDALKRDSEEKEDTHLQDKGDREAEPLVIKPQSDKKLLDEKSEENKDFPSVDDIVKHRVCICPSKPESAVSDLDDIIGPEDVFKRIGLDAWFTPGRLHPIVEALVYWRDPKKSGVVFGGVMAILLSICYMSLVSVVGYFSFLVVAGAICFRIYKNILQAIQKTSSEGHPFKDYLEVDLSLPQDKVREMTDTAVVHINAALVELRRLVFVEDLIDSVKFALCMWCLTYVGALFNGMTLVILAFVALFTVPKIYENNKASIDTYIEMGRSKVAEITSKVKAAVPIGKKEPEKDKEQ